MSGHRGRGPGPAGVGAWFVIAVMLCASGCASVSLYEDKKSGAKTELAVKGPRAVVEHTF